MEGVGNVKVTLQRSCMVHYVTFSTLNKAEVSAKEVNNNLYEFFFLSDLILKVRHKPLPDSPGQVLTHVGQVCFLKCMPDRAGKNS